MFNTECLVFVILALFLAGSAAAVVEGIASSLGRMKQELKAWAWKALMAALSMATYLFLFYLVRFFYFQKHNVAPIDVSAAAYATFAVEILRRLIAFQCKLLSTIAMKLFYATCSLASGVVSVLRSCFSFVNKDNVATAGAQSTSSSSSSSSPSCHAAPKADTRGASPSPHAARACRKGEADAEPQIQTLKPEPKSKPKPNSSQRREGQDPTAHGNRTGPPASSNCAHGSAANVCQTACGARTTVRPAILRMSEKQLLRKYKLLKQQRCIRRAWEAKGLLRVELVELGLRRRNKDVKAKATEHAARKAREAHEARARMKAMEEQRWISERSKVAAAGSVRRCLRIRGHKY